MLGQPQFQFSCYCAEIFRCHKNHKVVERQYTWPSRAQRTIIVHICFAKLLVLNDILYSTVLPRRNFEDFTHKHNFGLCLFLEQMSDVQPLFLKNYRFFNVAV